MKLWPAGLSAERRWLCHIRKGTNFKRISSKPFLWNVISEFIGNRIVLGWIIPMYLRLSLIIFYPDLARARWIQGEFQLKKPSWCSAGTKTWILILNNHQLEYLIHFAKAYRDFVCACRVCFCVQNPWRFE